MTTPAYQWGEKIARHLTEWDLPASVTDCIEYLYKTEHIGLTETERTEFYAGVRSVTLK